MAAVVLEQTEIGCCGRVLLQIVYIWVTSTRTTHDAIVAIGNRDIKTNHLLQINIL